MMDTTLPGLDIGEHEVNDRQEGFGNLHVATLRDGGIPEKSTIDRSGANTTAIDSHKADREVNIERRQNKYLNNLVEQDHRAVKRIV